ESDGELKMSDIVFSDFLYYDTTSPSFLRWKVDVGKRVRAGDQVGGLNYHGYYRTKLNGKEILAHRLVWILHNGSIPEGVQIDHIDGLRTNNDISNLRLASISENLQNQKISSKNTTGIKGLSWNVKDKIWRGSVQARGKRKHFSSKSKEEVESWLISTREGAHGDFARHS
ncbi:HNH endonuclease, partial [Providencia sp. PROV195]|uniref:HNH endonuclease n=2 Tax=Morganellaceae TaxID=1903414 RepID=UPI00234A3F61